jgi:hypothetical protein
MNTSEVIKILEDNKITNVVRITPKNKDERTPSEKLQDEIEPIPCPMHEDYDDEKNNV